MVLALSSHDGRGIRFDLETGSVLGEMRSEGAAWSGDFEKVGSETRLGWGFNVDDQGVMS